jgi:hypothetical protein
MPDSSPSTGTWREHHPLAFDIEYAERCQKASEMLWDELKSVIHSQQDE